MDESLFANSGLQRSNVCWLTSDRGVPATGSGLVARFRYRVCKYLLLILITAALISCMSRLLSSTTYLAGSSSSPCHTMGPATAGASLSGDVRTDELLRRLSNEDFALSVGDDILMDQLCGN